MLELRRLPGEGDGDQIEMELSYADGSVPPGFPERVTLTAPSALEDTKIFAQVKADNNETWYIYHCLPPDLRNGFFFPLLTDECRRVLLNQAMEMVMGERLAHYFRATFERLSAKRECQSNPT